MRGRSSRGSWGSTARAVTSSCATFTCQPTRVVTTSSPCPELAPTAGRSRATTTTSGAPASSQSVTVLRDGSSAAKLNRICSPATWERDNPMGDRMTETQTRPEPSVLHDNPQVLKVALLGCGTVGSQVARILLEDAAVLAARSGARLELAGIAVRNPDAARDVELPRELFTADAEGLVDGAD